MKQHSSRFLTLVNDVKKHIRELSAQELNEKMQRQEPMYIIDVREDNEWLTGHIPTAIHLSKGIIERDIEKCIEDPKVQIVVYCSGGFRCALVADSLQKMGYSNVYSLAEGLQGWHKEGLQLR